MRIFEWLKDLMRPNSKKSKIQTRVENRLETLSLERPQWERRTELNERYAELIQRRRKPHPKGLIP